MDQVLLFSFGKSRTVSACSSKSGPYHGSPDLNESPAMREHNPLRRQLLLAALAAPVLLSTSPVVANNKRDWRAVILDRDRFLQLERPQAGEAATFCYYRKASGWDKQGYSIACSLLRDVHSKRTVAMSPKLIDLLFLLQAWLRINKLPSKILITSGYRTPEYNSTLEGAAKQSMHVRAMAADISIPGVGAEQIAKLAKAIGVGGVGLYPSRNFIHVDIGRVRSWRASLEEPASGDWLAQYSLEEIDQVLAINETPDLNRIVFV